MSPSPLCGGIVGFEFYPHKNQCKIAWARVGGVSGVSGFPLGCSGWRLGVQRGIFWVFSGVLTACFACDIGVATLFVMTEGHVSVYSNLSMGHAGAICIRPRGCHHEGMFRSHFGSRVWHTRSSCALHSMNLTAEDLQRRHGEVLSQSPLCECASPRYLFQALTRMMPSVRVTEGTVKQWWKKHKVSTELSCTSA